MSCIVSWYVVPIAFISHSMMKIRSEKNCQCLLVCSFNPEEDRLLQLEISQIVFLIKSCATETINVISGVIVRGASTVILDPRGDAEWIFKPHPTSCK